MSHERVTELDATFLGYSQLSIGAIVLDPPPGRQAPDFAALSEAVGKHLRRSPSFRQCLHAVPLHVDRPVWVDDQGFDLQDHITKVPVPPGHEVTLDELAGLAAEASVERLDRQRAPWGLELVEPMEDGRLGLVATVDHVRADGIAALLFFTLLLADLPDDEAEPEPDQWEPQPVDDLRLLLEAFGQRFQAYEGDAAALERRLRSRSGITEVARSTLEEARGVPAVARYVRRGRAECAEPAPFNRTHAGTEVAMAFRDRELAPVEAAAHAAVPRATVNDAILAGVAAGLGDWLVDAGEPVRDLRTLMPVDVVKTRHDAPGPSNRASRSFVTLPVTEPDPVERLRLVRERTERVKHDDDARASLLLSRWVGRTPGRVSKQLRGLVDRECEAFNLVVSNFKGPDQPITILGCPVRLLYPLSTLAGHNGINVTVTSMLGRLCYSVLVNGQVIEDPGVVVAGIERTLDELERRRSP